MTHRSRNDAERPQPGALLAAHVPLSLLLDIAEPGGPHSQELYDAEGGDADWLVAAPPRGVAAATG